MTKRPIHWMTVGAVSFSLLIAFLPAPQQANAEASVPARLSIPADSSGHADNRANNTELKDHSDRHQHPRRHFFGGFAVKTTADLIGMNKAELINQLKTGRTLQQIVKDKKGWSESEYIQKLTDASSKKIDLAVQNGKIDAERAGKLKAALPTKFKEIINRNWSEEFKKHDSKTGAPDGIFRQHEAKMKESAKN